MLELSSPCGLAMWESRKYCSDDGSMISKAEYIIMHKHVIMYSIHLHHGLCGSMIFWVSSQLSIANLAESTPVPTGFKQTSPCEHIQIIDV